MQSRHWPIFSSYIFGLQFAIKAGYHCFNGKFIRVKLLCCWLSFVLVFMNGALAQDQLSRTKAERLYEKGTELAANSNFGAARKVFSEFLETASPTDPRLSEAEYYVALSALTLRHADAEKLVEDFIAHYPSSPKAATAYFDLANFFYQEKNYSKAVQYYKKVNFPALTQDQQNEAHFNWGYSYFNLKKLDEALEQFNFVKDLRTPYSPAANYYAGFVEYTNGLYDQALTDLRRAEVNASYATVVPYLIANVYYHQKQYDDLITYVTGALERDGIQNKDELSMLIGEAYYFKQDFQKAAEYYEAYLGDRPEKAASPILFRAGFANYSLSRNEKAISYLSKSASSKDSVSYYASYYLGILYLKQGDKNLAVNAFHVASKVPADRKLAEESTFQFAKVTYDAGSAERAIEEFEKFLKEFPASTHVQEVKELLAQAYVNGNNYHKAIAYIESLPSRTAATDRAYQKATYLAGAELFNKNQYQDAIKSFQKSLRLPIDPAYTALASFWAAEAYSVGRRYDEAIRHYSKVIGIPGTPSDLIQKTKYGLGYSYYNLKQYDKALVSFREFVNSATRTTPNYADGLIRLADCYYVSKQYSDALNTYTRARNIGSPDNDYVLLQTGVINGIQKNYGECRKLLTSLIQSYPKSQYRDEALFQRAQFEIEQGNAQAAIDGLSQLIRESTGSPFLPYAYMRRAASYYNKKEYQKTIDDYVAVLNQFPTHPVAQEVLLPLQEALTAVGRSGDFDTYMADFKKSNPDNKAIERIEFETGKSLFFDQLYPKAITSLSGFVTSYPESSLVGEASFYIAESHYRLQQYAKALPVYEKLGDDPTFPFASRVISRIAEIQFRNQQYEQAIRYFQRLERMASNKKEQYNAWSGLMESYYLLADYDSADIYARTILERGAVDASAQNKASLYLGKTAFARGDYETAKDEFLNTLNTAQDEFGAEAKYLLAQIFFLEKNYKQSYETLLSLNKDFSSYDEWVGKSFLLIADNFAAQEDYFQAKATLQSLIDHFPLEHVKTQAQLKLKEVEAAETAKRLSTQPDTVQNRH